jgi:hypothetical protein
LQHSVAANLQTSAFEETTGKLEKRFLKSRNPQVCQVRACFEASVKITR